MRAEMLYAERLIAPGGRAGWPVGSGAALSGYDYREARFLRTLSLALNGNSLVVRIRTGGPHVSDLLVRLSRADNVWRRGTGQSGDEESADEHGVPHRSIAVWLHFDVVRRGLSAKLTITNHARRHTRVRTAIAVAADFLVRRTRDLCRGGCQRPAQVEAIAETAVAEFGRIDTWVNNAAVSMVRRSTR